MTRALPPGSCIGILGGGQLGRMMAMAAAHLGYRTHIYAPEGDAPATDVSANWTRAPYDDERELAAFAAHVDAITLEFENIPVATLEYLARRKPVAPGANVLRVTQDRLLEKNFARQMGVETAPYRNIESDADVDAAHDFIFPAILKTRRLGYDGKGQARVARHDDLRAAWQSLGRAPAILEGFVAFRREASQILARGWDGEMVFYDPAENHHKNGILDVSYVSDALFSAAERERLRALAATLAQGLGIVGVLAVECFETDDGRWLMNEMAPRVHNSGHWTMDAAMTSQFEQAIRAVAGLPLGPTARHANAAMQNLIGDDVARAQDYLRFERARLYLYGKGETRAGRKMGHVNFCYPLDAEPKSFLLK